MHEGVWANSCCRCGPVRSSLNLLPLGIFCSTWYYKVRLMCLEIKKKEANLLCVFTRLRVAQWMLTLISFVFTLSAALDTDTHRLPTSSVVFVAQRSELTSSGRWCLFHIPKGYPCSPRSPSLVYVAKGVGNKQSQPNLLQTSNPPSMFAEFRQWKRGVKSVFTGVATRF